jgi:hypothetical protein
MSQILSTVAVIGIDIGKNSFHVVGLDEDGAIVLRQKWSRGRLSFRRVVSASVHFSLRRGLGACVSASKIPIPGT